MKPHIEISIPKAHNLPDFMAFPNCIKHYTRFLLLRSINSEYGRTQQISHIFRCTKSFTNIPLKETINITINTIFKHKPNFPINRTDLKMLFSFATTQSHFLFNNFIYDQIHGVAMGSPLAPILADLFMGHHETSWLENYKDWKILIYRGYVDDIFCLFNNEHDAMLFFGYINTQHPNIKFTHEIQLNDKLLFLDVLVDNSSNVCVISVFHK